MQWVNLLCCALVLLVSRLHVRIAEGYTLRLSPVLRPKQLCVVHAFPYHARLNSGKDLIASSPIMHANGAARAAEFRSLFTSGGRFVELMRDHQLTVISLFLVAMSLVYGIWSGRELQPSRQNSVFGGHTPVQQQASPLGRTGRLISGNEYTDVGPMPKGGSSNRGLNDKSRVRNNEHRLPATGEQEPSGPKKARNRPNIPQTEMLAQHNGGLDTAETMSVTGGAGVGDENTPCTVGAIGSPALRAPLGEQVQQELADQPSPAAHPERKDGGRNGGAQSATGVGFLRKFFQKPGGGRPAEVARALLGGGGSGGGAAETLTETLRALSALALLDCMPSATFPQGVVNDVMAAVKDANIRDTALPQGAGSVGPEELVQWVETHGVGAEMAAEAFADVTNALLVALVDMAVQAAESRESALCLARIEAALQFMAKAGQTYNGLAKGVQVEPIRYNGRARAAQLEDLYYRYAKAAMGAQGLLSSIGVQPVAEASEQGSPVSAEERQERLGRLQFLFSLKDGRRGSIEQRILRESTTDMLRGVAAELSAQGQSQRQDGDMGSLSSMLDGMMGRGPAWTAAASNAGAVAAPSDPAQVGQALRKSMSGLGLPDMDKLKPEDMAALSTEVVAQMKIALREGAVTRKDVLQLEQMMGVTVEALLAAVDGAGRMQAAGPQAEDMVAVLRGLAKLLKA